MRARKAILIAVALGASMTAAPARAGQIGIGDFSGSESVTTFDGLGLPTFGNLTPIVFDGNTYTTDDGVLRYSNVFAADCAAECIGNNSDLGYIDILLGSPASRVGARVGLNVTWSGFVEFFGPADVLLGTVTFTDETLMQFAGWEDFGGISRFRVTDTSSNQLIMHLDDFRFEGAAVPEPTSLALLGLGLAGFCWSRRRKA